MIAWGYVAGPGDYTEVTSRQLSFQPGTTRLCAPISITDDAILEDSETFSVQLNATDQSVILNSSSSTVLILDNDSESGLIFYKSRHYFSWPKPADTLYFVYILLPASISGVVYVAMETVGGISCIHTSSNSIWYYMSPWSFGPRVLRYSIPIKC